MNHIVDIDLSGCTEKKEIIRHISKALKIDKSPDTLYNNWDAFRDDIGMLEGCSKHWFQLVQKDTTPTAVHVRLNHALTFKEQNPSDYQVLIEILDEMSAPNVRYGKIQFSYEIHV